MPRFWDRRARENALFFVDNRLDYRDPDVAAFWRGGEQALDFLLGGLDTEPGCGDTVVDIGCGVGRLTRPLAARVGRVCALDVSEQMLDRARELNPDVTNVDWLLGDGRSLEPLPSQSVQGCVSLVTFQHIPDQRITLGYVEEIGRVLVPGGWAAFQVSNDPSVHRWRESLGSRTLAALGRAPRGRDHPAWLGSAIDLDQLGQAAHRGGLEIDGVEGAGTQFCLVRARRKSAPT